MKELTPPKIDAKEVYKQIKKNKHTKGKIILSIIESNIFSSYDYYLTNSKNLEKINKSVIMDKEHKDVLVDCYTRSKDSYFGSSVVFCIYNNLRQHNFICPYCMLNQPDELDHYIPKDKYPEFSIFPQNIIPCCSSCNSKKGDIWVENSDRQFLSLYYDSLPTEKYLKCKLKYQKDNMKKSIQIIYELDTSNIETFEKKQVLINHFHNLNLLYKYSEAMNEDLTIVNYQIEESFNQKFKIEQIIANMKIQMKSIFSNYGENNCRYALYDEIINTDYIENYYSYLNL